MSLARTTFRAFSEILTFARGRDQYLWDNHNRKYLDLFGHNMTVSVGHSHPRVVQAASDQLLALPHCSSVFHHPAPRELADELVRTFPEHPSGENWKVHLVNSGSEAVDLALQMSEVYTGSDQVMSLKNSYHGLQGLARNVTYVTRNVRNEDFADGRFPETFRDVPTYIFEPTQGYGGVNKISSNAVQSMRHHSQVLICDEIQTGMGRTGLGMWEFERYPERSTPDIVICAKGLGNGVGLIGAVVARESISEKFSERPFFNTYSSNPTACAAATEVLRVIYEYDYIKSNHKHGEQFRRGLGLLGGTELRGDGLMMGLEIKDEMGGQTTAISIQEKLKDAGIIAGRGGLEGNVIRIQPPYCITSEDITHTVDTIHRILYCSEM